MAEKPREEMTWQEKREERFHKWLDAANVKFIGPEAARKYRERATRMIKAIKMEIPDRVPVHITGGSIVAYNAGYTLKDMLYDYSKVKPAYIKWLNDYDQDSNDPPMYFPAKVYEILDYRMNKWPGHGLPDTATLHNFVEQEYMQANEYDNFIKDPLDFSLRRFTPRTWGVFEPLAKLAPFSSYQGLPQRLMTVCEDPAFKKLFKALRDAAKEQAKYQKVVSECARVSLEMGYPPLSGGVTLAPFDTVADMLRGTHGSVMDMYRQPEKLLETLEIVTERSVASAVEMVNKSRSPIIFIPMHKGDDSFMSVKQFEKFYWPTFRKLLLGLVNEGCVPMMVIDGSYNEARLKIISELPRSSVVWTMEKTDMFKAKEILGNSACIAGNVTAAQLYTQTPQTIKEYCRRLIEVCGKGGGYILSLGSGIDKCDPANLRAIVEAAREYGQYRN
ncbi:MAG TPA: uroporphyrinogen decarboxylase family protein [Dehalococcoidales bacterium]|nr:uroporphyrinogen decarboxylase family protein [Dehalococcoidales bacterium]